MSSKVSSSVTEDLHGYPALEELIRRRVALAGTQPVYTTDPEPLFSTFLEWLPPSERQHYTCACCRRFFDRYGALVTIAENGEASPLLWGPDDVPVFFSSAVARLWRMVKNCKVAGVFLWKDAVWGTPVTGQWTHLSGEATLPKLPVTKTADQVMAEKREDYKILQQGLEDYDQEVVAAAVRILDADALDRSEKTLGVASWFLALHRAVEANRPRRNNLVWRAVAMAPPGFCHVRSTMISTLLDDLKAGLPLETIQARWAQKMHPLQYQRAQAAVKEGQIKAANAVVAKLKSAGALSRRFAKLEDVTYRLWEPRPAETAPPPTVPPGPFDKLVAKGKAKLDDIELPARTMTWVKFQAEVLPGACEISLRVPLHRSSFVALVTAADPAAPLLFQWDNPVSWYMYVGGSSARDWDLLPGAWVSVPLITTLPSHWGDPEKLKHHNPGLVLVLAGAKDKRHTAGGGWFPESLKAEYHEIRAAMEHLAEATAIVGLEEGNANGLLLSKGDTWSTELRVRDRSGTALYRLDRWD